jgi:hypothetical protein
LTLDTKSRQNIIGLAVVHDQLLVFCPRATERVSGFTEDDLNIDIAQPQIGCISHFAVVNIHGNLWVPTHLGVYVTDGSGWFFMMKDTWTVFRSEYAANRAVYEAAWAYHDPISEVYKLYVADHSDTGGKTFWVADYSVVLPQVGGNMSQPNWSYDVSARSYDSAGVLAVPGGRRVDTYLGACSGDIYLENVESNGNDASDALGKRLLWRTGADFHGDVGGDLAHGKVWVEDDAFVRAEENAWEYHVYAGDEECHPGLLLTSGSTQTTGPNFDSGTIPASAGTGVDPDTGFTGELEPKSNHHFTLEAWEGVVGRARVTEIVGTAPIRMEIRGYQTLWRDGDTSRRLINLTIPG